ncbi:MAG: CDP-alcohol phosphatidyltransferase family protein [Candidatus Binatia bacterium]
MRIWIDATSRQSHLPLFGMSLLERQLRTIVQAGITPLEVAIQLPSRDSPAPTIPHDLIERLPIHWLHSGEESQPALPSVLRSLTTEPLLALSADAVVDTRLLQHLTQQKESVVVYGGEDNTRTAALWLTTPVSLADPLPNAVLPLADTCVEKGAMRNLPLTEVPTYIKKLRRDLPAYLFRVTDEASRDEAESFLFWSNYKGSTDFFTKYVYPPLVWRMVRSLARWRVHPNVVTIASIILTLAAVPLFATEHWLAGFLCAYSMSVLDSVDGKLARLTFRASWIGNILDHGLDLVHPPLWYFGWAWALGGGNHTAAIFQATIGMTIFYILDRIVTRVFTARVGRSLYSCTPFDTRMRTFISRRNINLPVFMLGWLLGIPLIAFTAIILWQILTFAYHTTRLIQFWNSKAPVTAENSY